MCNVYGPAGPRMVTERFANFSLGVIMRNIQLGTAALIALLILGCSKSGDSTSTAIVAKPQTVKVVHQSGIPPPGPISVVQPGVASEGCANNDGPAVELVFKVEGELPTASFGDWSMTESTLVFGPPVVGNQELHVKVNATLPKVKELRQWTISNPDTDGGLLAWVCPANGYPCDFATAGSVTFTLADDELIAGHADLIFQSKNTVLGRLQAKLVPRVKLDRPSMCG